MNFYPSGNVQTHWFQKLLEIKFDNNSTKNLLHKIVETTSQEINKHARDINALFYYSYFTASRFEGESLEERYQHTLEQMYDEEMNMPFPDDQIKPIDLFFGHYELHFSSPKYFMVGGSLDITQDKEPGSGNYRKNFLQRDDFGKMYELFVHMALRTRDIVRTLHRIVDTITFLGRLDVSMLNEDGDVVVTGDYSENIWPIVERDTRVTASYYLEFLLACFMFLVNQLKNEDEIVILQECPYVFDRFISSREPNLAYHVVNFLETNVDNSGYRINTQWMRSSQQYNSLSILSKILSMNTCVNDAYVDANMLRFADLNVTVGNNPVLTSYTQVQKALLQIFLMLCDIDISERDSNANVTAREFARLQYNHINNQVQSGNGEKQPLYDRIVQDYSGIVNLITSLEGDSGLKEDVSSLIQQKEMSKVLSPVMGSKLATYPQAEILTNRPGGPTIGSIKRKVERAAERASQGDPNYPKPINPNRGGKKKTKKQSKKLKQGKRTLRNKKN